MDETIRQIQKDYLEKINQAGSLKLLDEIFIALFGKSGKVTLLPRGFSKLSKEELQKVGPLFNQVKGELEITIREKREAIREEGYQKLEDEKLDLNEIAASSSSPRNDINKKGHLHPLTVFENEIVDIFSKLDFQIFEAPHIESEHYNFEVLNIPPDHPARDLWDTLYIDQKGPQPGKLLLRPHTSNAQVRIMEKYQPPIRMMMLDRCFRKENLDARHEHTFDQFEIVYIDKNVSMANLQYLSEVFSKAIFSKDIKVRLRPKYYPFVEPGAGVDGLCMFCLGKGCQICGGVGWLELAGAGMIHPTVLKNGGIDPDVYSGIAWGFGLDRMVMLKNGIEDMRKLRSGDLRILSSF